MIRRLQEKDLWPGRLVFVTKDILAFTLNNSSAPDILIPMGTHCAILDDMIIYRINDPSNKCVRVAFRNGMAPQTIELDWLSLDPPENNNGNPIQYSFKAVDQIVDHLHILEDANLTLRNRLSELQAKDNIGWLAKFKHFVTGYFIVASRLLDDPNFPTEWEIIEDVCYNALREAGIRSEDLDEIKWRVLNKDEDTEAYGEPDPNDNEETQAIKRMEQMEDMGKLKPLSPPLSPPSVSAPPPISDDEIF